MTELAQLINDRQRELGLSTGELALRAGQTYWRMRRLAKDERIRPMFAAEARALANALEIPAAQIFAAEGLLEKEEHHP